MHASETHQFVTVLMPGVLFGKVPHMRVGKSSARDAVQIGSQHLRAVESHDSLSGVIRTAEALRCQMMHEIQSTRMGRLVIPRHKLPPEYRQKTIGSESGDDEQPIHRVR